MKTLPPTREARNPMEEGISLLPYVPVFQRMHRRRWGAALLAAATAGGIAWLMRRLRAR